MDENNAQKKSFYDSSKVETYAGYYRHESILKKSASGGAASAISEAIINMNGVVFGAVYSEDFRSVHYACAASIDELEQFKGSKYIAAEPVIRINGDKKSVYEAVSLELQSNKNVLFTGTGCYIGALYSYLKKKEVPTDHLYTVDLICHGPTFPEVEREFVEYLEKRYRSKIVDFTVRYKKNGWKPPYVRAIFQNGKVFEKPFYETFFGYTFKILSKECCFNCRFKGDKHIADITVGDYWGVDKNTEIYNANGVSVIFSRTEKGKYILDSINKDSFCLFEIDSKYAADHNRMFYKSRDKASDFDQFSLDFKDKGLNYAVRHSSGYHSFMLMCIKRSIKRRVPKQILLFLGRSES